MTLPPAEHWIWGILALLLLSGTFIFVFLRICSKIKVP